MKFSFYILLTFVNYLEFNFFKSMQIAVCNMADSSEKAGW